MLKITVELLPVGSEEYKETLAEGVIWNDMTITNMHLGNYKARFTDKTKNTFAIEVYDFERSKDSVWKLIWMCLDRKFKEE